MSENDELCEYAGHEWLPAGGGLLICGRCQAEKWDDGDDEYGECGVLNPGWAPAVPSRSGGGSE